MYSKNIHVKHHNIGALWICLSRPLKWQMSRSCPTYLKCVYCVETHKPRSNSEYGRCSSSFLLFSRSVSSQTAVCHWSSCSSFCVVRHLHLTHCFFLSFPSHLSSMYTYTHTHTHTHTLTHTYTHGWNSFLDDRWQVNNCTASVSQNTDTHTTCTRKQTPPPCPPVPLCPIPCQMSWFVSYSWVYALVCVCVCVSVSLFTLVY